MQYLDRDVAVQVGAINNDYSPDEIATAIRRALREVGRRPRVEVFDSSRDEDTYCVKVGGKRIGWLMNLSSNQIVWDQTAADAEAFRPKVEGVPILDWGWYTDPDATHDDVNWLLTLEDIADAIYSDWNARSAEATR